MSQLSSILLGFEVISTQLVNLPLESLLETVDWIMRDVRAWLAMVSSYIHLSCPANQFANEKSHTRLAASKANGLSVECPASTMVDETHKFCGIWAKFHAQKVARDICCWQPAQAHFGLCVEILSCKLIDGEAAAMGGQQPWD